MASYTSFIESSDHATSRRTWIDMTVACEWSVVIIHALLLRGSFPAGAGPVLPSLFTAALVRVVLRELLRPLIGQRSEPPSPAPLPDLLTCGGDALTVRQLACPASHGGCGPRCGRGPRLHP